MNHDNTDNKKNDELWNAIHRIETSVKNTQDSVKKLFLHSARHEMVIEALDKKVDRLDKKVDRLDKKVDTLDKKVDTLDKKVDTLDKKVDAHQQENRERFDKIEDTLTIIVNHLKK